MSLHAISSYLAARDELERATACLHDMIGGEVDGDAWDAAQERVVTATRAEAEALAALRQAELAGRGTFFTTYST